MNLQVLVSTMHQTDYSLLEKMNIDSDVIVINQCDRNAFEELQYKDNKVKFYSFNERGVGRSRNNALIRATGDICVMADDDVVYVDGYKDIITNAFRRNPNADMIVFNVRIHDNKGIKETVSRKNRVRFYNCLRYGTVSFAFKRDKIYGANIFFSLLFGGGAKYGSGEDSLFIWECLKKGLKVYSEKDIIADVYNYESSWFEGYNEKYLIDNGALFAALTKRFSLLLIFQFAIRKSRLFRENISIINSIKLMIKGMKEFDNNF